MTKRPLYLATSLQQLNKQVDRTCRVLKLDTLCRVSESLYKKATEISNAEPLDEEMLYIMCFRYLSLVDKIKQKEKDERFHRSLFAKPVDMIEQIRMSCEKSLAERYTALPEGEAAGDDKPAEKTEKPAAFTFENSGDMFVSSEALYNIMTDDKVKVLIIDIRSQVEYTESRLKHTHVLNIPNHLIAQGLSTNTLKQRLPPTELEVFESRAIFDYIVLMDLETTRYNYNMTKVEDLRSILVDWDLEAKIGLILVLDGGIRAIGDTHPSVIINPLSLVTHIFNEFDDQFMGEIEYPELITEVPDLFPHVHGTVNMENEEMPFSTLLPPRNSNSSRSVEVSDIQELPEIGSLETESSKGNQSDQTNSVSDISSDLSVDQSTKPEMNLFGIYTQMHVVAESEIRVEEQLLDFAERRLNIKKHILEQNEKPECGYFQLKAIDSEVSRAESTKITLKERRALLDQTHQKLKQQEQVTAELETMMADINSVDRKVLLKYQCRKKIEQDEKVVDKEMLDKGFITNWKPLINLIKTDSRPEIDRRTKPTDNTVLHLVSALNCAYQGNGLVGLYNIRNTCYLNSIVQCLRFCPPFLYYVTFEEIPKKLPNSRVLNHLADLIKKMWSENNVSVHPSLFYAEVCKVDQMKTGYAEGRHEDVQEFFLFLTKAMHNETQKPFPSTNGHDRSPKLKDWIKNFADQDSFVTRMFYHQLELTTTCPKCDKAVVKYDYGNTIFVNVPDSNKSINISDELKKFLKVPHGEKSRFCTDCELETVLKKRITYYPTILAVNIVRYYFDPALHMIRRSNNECIFNQEIYFGRCRYELKAISLHQGDRDVGHYTALCYHPFQNRYRWVEFNDGKWGYTQLDTTPNRVKCYMLFYTIAHNPEEVNKNFFNV